MEYLAYAESAEHSTHPLQGHRGISITLNQSFAELGRNKRSCIGRAANTSQLYPRRKFPHEYQLALASHNNNPKQATYGPSSPFGQDCLERAGVVKQALTSHSHLIKPNLVGRMNVRPIKSPRFLIFILATVALYRSCCCCKGPLS